eukprot:TRINITY_DN7526_c0_g1_i1.p1 TRINITY_DN7526_c0_g1~~TRINITY_DN7526_c0_g1_i1.p1  ORF type:complete len:631 (+),score=129.95 TRINITY_DN7526_c0_g1_i1:72-1895(+)
MDTNENTIVDIQVMEIEDINKKRKRIDIDENTQQSSEEQELEQEIRSTRSRGGEEDRPDDNDVNEQTGEEDTARWYKELENINLSQTDSPNKGSGKKISLIHQRRSGRQLDREEDIFDKEELLEADLYENEDMDTIKEMTWTIVIIVYKPATTKTVGDLITKMDGLDQDAILTIKPKFKQDVVIIQSSSWMDIRRVAHTLNTILGNKVEIILSLEKDVATEPYRTLVGFLQTQKSAVLQRMREENLKNTLEEKLKDYKDKEITVIPSRNLVIVNFRTPRERARAAEDRRLMNEGAKSGKYKVVIEGKPEDIRINWKANPTPEGTHPFQLTFGHGKDMGTKVRNHNMDKIFKELRKDNSPILPTKIFQDQMEGTNITIVEFANTLDMARYMRNGIKIGDQTFEMIQLGMLLQRKMELKTTEENRNKQIMLRRPTYERNNTRVEPEGSLNSELVNEVKDNTREIGDLWTAVAAMTQAHSDQWQYNKMQNDVGILLQLKGQLEDRIVEIKSKLRVLEVEKKIAKMEGNPEQKELKEKFTKLTEKWKTIGRELSETEEKIKECRGQMEQIHQSSIERIMDWGRNSSARIGNLKRSELTTNAPAHRMEVARK